jgi:hypothetical protein
VLRELDLDINSGELRRLSNWYSVGGETEVDYARMLKDIFPKSNNQLSPGSLPSLAKRQESVLQERKSLEKQLNQLLLKEKALKGGRVK